MAKARLDDPLTVDQLRSLLDYHPKLGLFFWRRRPEVTQYDRSWNTRYAGSVAGTPTVPRGYVQILLNGKLYLGHRLAFLWMTGKWPEFEGDHIDGNPSNNRWSNLRDATRGQGMMNTGPRSDNGSGYRGVYWSTTKRRWVANIYANKKRHYIGYFDTAEAAHAAYAEAAKRLHGEFARTG